MKKLTSKFDLHFVHSLTGVSRLEWDQTLVIGKTSLRGSLRDLYYLILLIITYYFLMYSSTTYFILLKNVHYITMQMITPLLIFTKNRNSASDRQMPLTKIIKE